MEATGTRCEQVAGTALVDTRHVGSMIGVEQANGNGQIDFVDITCYVRRNGQVTAIYSDGTAAEVAEKKVAIVGRAPSTLHLVPYDDPSWEVWGLSNAASAGMVKRWNAWFELHPFDSMQHKWPKDYLAWLKEDHGKPVYIGAEHEACPHGTVYPWRKVLDKFGRYFNNSIAEMVALAILEGATDLAIYGVDMAQSDPALHNGQPEYQHQRPSCEHMIGWCRGMGIPVHIPIESDLLKCHKIYAYEGNDNALARKLKVRKPELEQRQRQMMVEREHVRTTLSQQETLCARLEGQIEEIDRQLKQAADPNALNARKAELKKNQANIFNHVKADAVLAEGTRRSDCEVWRRLGGRAVHDDAGAGVKEPGLRVYIRRRAVAAGGCHVRVVETGGIYRDVFLT